MGAQSRTVEERLAGLASRRHGLVTRQQLLAAGVSRREIARRLRIGSLIQVHRGVYRVGHAAPSLESRYLAAVLACGDRAVLSGLPAAHLLGLVQGRPLPPEVTAPTERRVDGIVTRRARLDRSDRTLWRGIPVTSVPRTFVDIAARLSPPDLARAFHKAGIRHHTTPEQVEEALARRPNAPGAGELRRVVRGDSHVTLSYLERRFLTLIAAVGLDPPQTNKKTGSHFVDCRWPAAHVTVGLDSYRYHRSRHAWEQDRRREREARARGDDFRRYTYDDVFEEPDATIRDLKRLLQGSIRPRRIA